ncbi:MAG: hypothetical protein U0166_14295 [Acidobacteriota bacterium]
MTQLPNVTRRSRALALLAPVAIFAISMGCGKKGPPRPPVKVRPETVADLTLTQRGRTVTVSFTLPISTNTGIALKAVTEAEVLRLKEQEPPVEPGTESAPRDRFIASEDFMKDAEPLTKVERVDMARFLKEGRIEVTDDLVGEPLGGEAPSRFYYGVQVTDTEGRESLISNIESIVPLEPPLPPVDLTAEVEATKVALDWSPPASGPSPAGYNVYRIAGQDLPRLVTPTPVTETKYDDYALPGAEPFIYLVRSTATISKPYVESGDAAKVTVGRKDTQAPDPPTRVRSSAAQGRIEIYWDKSPSADLEGYAVYRASSKDGPFVKLTAKPVAETVYIDGTADAGKTYYYQIAAVDPTGNESSRTAPVAARR